MKLPPPGGGDFQPCPAGTHPAICIRVIDLGTQQTTYKGETKRAHKVLIAWEMPTARMSDGRPFIVSQRYTYSGHKKAVLRQHLESWRGKRYTDEEIAGVDLVRLLGKPCFLTIVHDESHETVYANVVGISPLPKNMAVGKPENPLVCLDLAAFDPAVFDGLSERLKATIQKSPEYHEAITGKRPIAEDEPPPHDPDDVIEDAPVVHTPLAAPWGPPAGSKRAPADLDDDAPF
jgi:hypothetical protein